MSATVFDRIITIVHYDGDALMTQNKCELRYHVFLGHWQQSGRLIKMKMIFFLTIQLIEKKFCLLHPFIIIIVGGALSDFIERFKYSVHVYMLFYTFQVCSGRKDKSK